MSVFRPRSYHDGPCGTNQVLVLPSPRAQKEFSRGMRRTIVGFCLLLSLVAQPCLAEESRSERISFSGYGDIHYNNPAVGTMKQSAVSEADVHRLVLGWGYE